MFLNLATGAKPEGRAELCSTENKRCSGIRWLTLDGMGHAHEAGGEGKDSHKQHLEMGTAEITAPCPAIPVIWGKQGEVPLELLLYSMLSQPCHSQPGEQLCWRQGRAPIHPCGDGTARMCCVVKGFTYGVSLRVVCSMGQLVTAFI